MKISTLLNEKIPTLSFEVFPPKTEDNFDSVKYATEEIAKIKPDYMSVTYGAGGGTSKYTLAIAENIQNNYGVTPLAHLTCVSSTKEMIKNQLTVLREKGIENILALRGDIPDGLDMSELDYHYAYELVDEIKQFGDFCVGGACYPEGHIESHNQKEDIENLKRKVDAGCE
ncbi:MAG: methylenetetrahydrofolate reductase, partial [Clostridia bacterium]|nr:methylenetetrahydrofolate reductase [Clostridia bacterium]